MKRIKLKIIDYGDKIEIVSWKNIKKDEELLYGYTKKAPCFYEEERSEEVTMGVQERIKGILLCNNDEKKLFIKQGSVLSRQEFKSILEQMKKGGEKLHQILETKREAERVRHLNTKIITI